MDFHLRSWAVVGQLISQKFGKKRLMRGICKYPTSLGFTSQKPIKRAYKQSPAAVQAWLEGEYPAIEQITRSEVTEIYRVDETALVNMDVRGRSSAPAGKTPIALVGRTATVKNSP